MNSYQAKLQLKEHGKIGAENTIVCPHCFYSWGTEKESNGAPFKKNIFECYECKKEFSVDCEPTGDYWFSTSKLKEPDPLFRVEFPHFIWNEDAAELQEKKIYLALDITSDESRFVYVPNQRDDFRTDLTEVQIKSMDERYWAFAVPVGNPTK